MTDPMIEAARRASASKDDDQLPMSFDAADWAKTFHKCFPDGPDPDVMAIWFGKALSRGFAEALKRLRTPPIAVPIPQRGTKWIPWSEIEGATGCVGPIGARGAD